MCKSHTVKLITYVLFLLLFSPLAYAKGSACVGNLVWLDSNGDGIKNNSESGQAGVTIRLENVFGLVLDKVTSANGYFKVCGSTAGEHRMVLEIPDGYSISPKDQGRSDFNDSDADQLGSVDVDLILGRKIGKYDIGLVADDGSEDPDGPEDPENPDGPDTPPPVDNRDDIPFGTWVEHRHRNDAVFGRFNGALLWAGTDVILSVLEDARASDTSLYLQLGSAADVGWNFSTGTSSFTLAKWKRSVDRFADDLTIRTAIESAINDGVIRGIYLIDEPHHKRWSPSGNSNNHIPNADIDEMARHVKSYWPNARTSVRASPRTLVQYNRGRHAWRYLDEAFLMINYRKWARNGDRTLAGFFKREISEANEQGLGLIGSLQMLIGAPPSDQQWWPSGGAKPVGKLKLSPIEMRTYVDAFLARRNSEGVRDPNGKTAVTGIMVFRWDRNNENDWENTYFSDAISEAQSVVNNWKK